MSYYQNHIGTELNCIELDLPNFVTKLSLKGVTDIYTSKFN